MLSHRKEPSLLTSVLMEADWWRRPFRTISAAKRVSLSSAMIWIALLLCATHLTVCFLVIFLSFISSTKSKSKKKGKKKRESGRLLFFSCQRERKVRERKRPLLHGSPAADQQPQQAASCCRARCSLRSSPSPHYLSFYDI